MNGVCTCASQSGGRGGVRYIRQQDELRAHLTVHEAMALAAALKLADFNNHERKEKVKIFSLYSSAISVQKFTSVR